MQNFNFAATTTAIASVFLLALVGYISVKRRLLSHTGVTEIARVLIDFILPAALFYAMFSQYTPDKLHYLKWVGMVQLSMMLTGGMFAWAAHRMLRLRSHRGTAIVLASMQNNIYLPLPLCIALLSPADSVRAVFFVGCFVLFFSPILWSVGVLLIRSSSPHPDQNPKGVLVYVLSPPFLAAVAGLLLKMLFLRLGISMPMWILNLTKIAGDATTPLAMIVLGAILAEAKWDKDFDFRTIAMVATSQLLLLPALVLLAMAAWSKGDPIFAFVAMLQAACPPATNITLVAKRFGGNSSLVAVTIFITYLLALLTIPFWLTAFVRTMY
jgi:malate permease and related proteins